MKINAINTIKNTFSITKTTTPISFKSANDTFIKTTDESILPKRFLEKRKIDIEDYKSLTAKEISEIKEKAPISVKQAVEDNLFVANLVKGYLDHYYGEDNYVFASIGRSPAVIGRVLEFSGVETKYLPISNFKNYGQIIMDLKDNPKGEKKYLSFLKEQGINSKEIENNDKTIIFTDYTDYGRTLQNFQRFLKEKANINNDEKVKFISLNNLIYYSSKKFQDNKEISLITNDYMDKYLACSKIEDYGGVPRLRANDFDDMDNIIENDRKESAKFFNLIVMDELNKNGKLKYNPLNKNSL